MKYIIVRGNTGDQKQIPVLITVKTDRCKVEIRMNTSVKAFVLVAVAKILRRILEKDFSLLSNNRFNPLAG